MNNTQVLEFLSSQLKTRWPKWQPNEIEVRDWLGWLENYDYDIAEKAAKEHARTSKIFKRPVTGEFFALCDELQAERVRQGRQWRRRRKRPIPMCVECVESDPLTGLPRKGFRFIVFDPSKLEDLNPLAEKYCEYYRKYYGGRWRVKPVP